MTTLLRTMRYSALALGVAAPLCVGCSSSSDSSGSPSYKILGTVTDANDTAIAGAIVQLGNANVVTQSAADGSFSLQFPAGSPNALPVIARHRNFASASRILTATTSPNDLQSIVLRPFDVVADIVLPDDPNALPATVEVSNATGGTAILSFAAGSLTLPTGVVASGTVQVKVSYWGTQDDHADAPSTLQGIEADGSKNALDTFGMIDFSAYQGDTLLNVADDQPVQVDWTLTPEQNDAFNAPDSTLPNLYSIDPNSGIWTYATTAERIPDGTYPSKPGIEARHLAKTNLGVCSGYKGRKSSKDNVRLIFANGKLTMCVGTAAAWNIDLGIYASNGGCQTGRTVDACTGKVVTNTRYTNYLLSIEQVAKFDARSDDDGVFCLRTPYSTWTAGAVPATVFFTPTTYHNFASTAYCNPAAKLSKCFAEHKVDQDGKDAWVSDCRISDADKQKDQVQVGVKKGYPYRYYQNCVGDGFKGPVKAPLVMKVYPCTFCSGDGPQNGKCTANVTDKTVHAAPKHASCTNLGDIKVATATCKCDRYGNCASTNVAPPGPVCKVNHTLGSACFVDPGDTQNKDKFLACCSTEKQYPAGSLQCLDAVCIATNSLGGS